MNTTPDFSQFFPIKNKNKIIVHQLPNEKEN
jgi:hypothetical protein